jgi:hypothetical protein
LKEEDKYIIRKSLLELATKGVRPCSIDQELSTKNSRRIANISENDTHSLWDSITFLGAQLSRPAYDPYREAITLTTSIGRETTITSKNITLTMPIIIHGDNIFDTMVDSFCALHIALNRLAEDHHMIIGLTISKDNLLKNLDNRKYPLFLKVSNNVSDENKLEECLSCSDGIILELKDNDCESILKDMRNKFSGPIIAEITNNNFSNDILIPLLLDAGVDGIFVDTERITKNSVDGKRHAIAIIRELRYAINSYYNKIRKNNDGVSLIVSGNVNSSGNIAKAIALGADIIAYSTSLIIANAEIHDHSFLEKHSSGSAAGVNVVAEKICKHILATRGEIKAITAAMGYSNVHNISPSDLRTSNTQASIQGNIPLEGIEMSYIEILEALIDNYLQKEGISIDDTQRHQVLLSLLKDRRILQ